MTTVSRASATTRWRAAVHEAGHSVVASAVGLTPLYSRLQWTGGGWTGETIIDCGLEGPDADNHVPWARAIMAGSVAEYVESSWAEAVLPTRLDLEEQFGAADDLDRIRELGRLVNARGIEGGLIADTYQLVHRWSDSIHDVATRLHDHLVVFPDGHPMASYKRDPAGTTYAIAYISRHHNMDVDLDVLRADLLNAAQAVAKKVLLLEDAGGSDGPTNVGRLMLLESRQIDFIVARSLRDFAQTTMVGLHQLLRHWRGGSTCGVFTLEDGGVAPPR